MRLSSIDTHLVVALHALLVEKSVTRAAPAIFGRRHPADDEPRARAPPRRPSASLLRRGAPTSRPMPAGAGAPKGRWRGPSRGSRASSPSRGTLRPVSRRAHVPDRGHRQPRAHRLARARAPHRRGRAARRAAVPTALFRLGRRASRRAASSISSSGAAAAPRRASCASCLARESFVCLVRRGHPDSGRFTQKRFLAVDHLLVAPHGGERGAVSTARFRLRGARAPHRRHRAALPGRALRRRAVGFRADRSGSSGRCVGPTLSLAVALPCPVQLPGYSLDLVFAEWGARRRRALLAARRFVASSKRRLGALPAVIVDDNFWRAGFSWAIRARPHAYSPGRPASRGARPLGGGSRARPGPPACRGVRPSSARRREDPRRLVRSACRHVDHRPLARPATLRDEREERAVRELGEADAVQGNELTIGGPQPHVRELGPREELQTTVEQGPRGEAIEQLLQQGGMRRRKGLRRHHRRTGSDARRERVPQALAARLAHRPLEARELALRFARRRRTRPPRRATDPHSPPGRRTVARDSPPGIPRRGGPRVDQSASGAVG